MGAFNAIAQESDQVFMPYMANSFNFHPKFLLCLSSACMIYINIQVGKQEDKMKTLTTYKLLRSLLTATIVPLMSWPLYTIPYPPSPITFSFENLFVAISKSLRVNQ